MSTDENREEDTKLSNSQESNTRSSKASTERDDDLNTKEPADKRKVVVMKRSDVEYKENNQIEYSTAEEQNKEERGEVERSDAAAKAKEAGISFTEMIKTLGKKAVAKTEEKTKEIRDRSIEAMDIGTEKNTRDIQALGIHAGNVVLVYERIMFEIEREDYDEGGSCEEKLLTGYKKLLEEQTNVIDSKLSIAKRLKNISK